MKKILILSLVALSFLLVSCTQGTVVGKAYDPAVPDSFRTELCTLLKDGCGPTPTPNIELECRDVNVPYPYSGTTGYELCRTNGFDTCTGAVFSNITTYFASTDGSCSSVLQFRDVESSSAGCNHQLEMGDSCILEGILFGSTEPAVGDVRVSGSPQFVNCCRLVGPIVPS